MEHALTEWAREAGPDEDRLEAKARILACFDEAIDSPGGGARLCLDRLGLKSLPDCISNLTALTELYLFLNQLTTVPESIGNLTALTSLDLHHNQLTTVPESICNLTALRRLDLCINHLTTVPDSIGNLTALTTLNLAGNRLTTLPESIVNLAALTNLELGANCFTTLPESIFNLAALTTLILCGNDLTTVPDSIGNLTALTKLDLSGNHLTAVPESIGNLTALRQLRLDSTFSLATLPESIGNLAALTYLRLDENRLTTLPESIGNLTALTQLYLDGNDLTSLPARVIELPSSCRIDLGDTALPPAVMEDLSRALELQRTTHPGTGPVIEHAMPAGPQLPERSLHDEITAWYQESAAAQPDPATWTHTIAAARLDPQSLIPLSQLLARLRLTAHYRLAQSDMQQRVHALLEQLKSDREALAACAALAVEGTETCDDRIALSFLLMEEALQSHTAQRAVSSPDAPQTLRAIARSLYKSEVLRRLANDRADAAVGFVDRTEFILKYWVKLSAELELPCKLSDMIFHRCAEQVSDADIDHAREQVLEAERDTDRFASYLANWAPWQALLAHHLPDDYQAAQAEITAFKDRCHQDLEAMQTRLEHIARTQGEYSPECLDLRAEINGMSQKIRDFETACIKALAQKLDS